MNIELLCYASGRHWENRRHLVASAHRFGRFQRIHCCNRGDIPADYRKRHRAILGHRKGDGYWLWKPYLLLKRLESMQDGDLLFYADSGCRFIADPAPLCELALETPLEVLVFDVAIPESHYTKRLAFTALGLDHPRYKDSRQIVGSFILLRAGARSRAFVREWLARCERPELITDSPSPEPPGEYPEFKSHRHDQSLLSLTCKQREIPAYPDPSQFGNDRADRTRYAQIFDHHRGAGLPAPRSPADWLAFFHSRFVCRAAARLRRRWGRP